MIGAHPFGGYKKGADGGVDGIACFKTGKRTSGFAIVQVKSDKKVETDMIDRLNGVLRARDADIGIFICLAKPTEPMLREALNAGKMEFDGETYPRIQILTVEDLFLRKRPKMPPLYKDLRDLHEDRPLVPASLSQEELRRQHRLKLPIRGGKEEKGQTSLTFAPPTIAAKRRKAS